MTGRELEDERTFLLRSLEDLDREHEAGDLSDEDHAVLRDGYVARAARVLKSLEGGPVAPAAVGDGPRRPLRGRRRGGRRRRVLVTAVVGLVIGCAVWAVVDEASIRLPGESATGSVTVTGSQQLERTLVQAETLVNEGNVVEALKLYESVLDQDPSQEEALAEVGWLEYEAGAQGEKASLLGLGERQEEQAERVDPAAPAPHLYLGSMLLAQGDPTAAVAQYRLFLADHPRKATVSAAVPFITKAFSEAHQVPPALAVGGPSSG
jgi:tetratricopeptide (TPR) repeat protein